jgi:alkanesulfonate monooxygenase SsuD/methylene tetrahydromethanopterin reductase-like flavin-dependent oxidoreductase (luciferase family)
MAERLGLAVIPGIGWRATEIQAIALEAEEAGFDAIFAAEVRRWLPPSMPVTSDWNDGT